MNVLYIIIFYLIFINILGFLTFFIDKQKSKNNKWRISEKTLFLIAIFGGSLGCMIGMKQFRHKTKHLKFTIFIPTILIIQLALLIFIIYYNYSK